MKSLRELVIFLVFTVLCERSDAEFKPLEQPKIGSSLATIANPDLKPDPWIFSDNSTKLLEQLFTGEQVDYFAGDFYDQFKGQVAFCDFYPVHQSEHRDWFYIPAVCVPKQDCLHPAPFENVMGNWSNNGCIVAANYIDSAYLPQNYVFTYVCCPINGTRIWDKFVLQGDKQVPEPSDILLSEIPPSYQLYFSKHVADFFVSSRHNEELQPGDQNALRKFFEQENYKLFEGDYDHALVCGFRRSKNRTQQFNGKDVFRWYPFFCVKKEQCGVVVGDPPNPLWHQFCNLERSENRVCCDIENVVGGGLGFTTENNGFYFPFGQLPTFLKYAPGLRSAYKCEEYAKRLCNSKAEDGGSLCMDKKTDPPTFGEFPHFASLGSIYKKIIQFNCGGTLISLRYIISSASCAYYWGYKVNIAMLGERSTNTHDAGTERYYVITDVVKLFGDPPAFRQKPWQTHTFTKDDDPDIALFRTSKEVEFTRYIHPACLWHVDKAWDHTEFIGYGSGYYYRRDILRVLDGLQIIHSNDKPWCYKLDFYRDFIENPIYGVYDATEDYLTCMGLRPSVFSPGRYVDLNPCGVDRGGPLISRVSYPYCTHMLLAVLSSNNECKEGREQPSIFVQVDKFLRAIEDEIWGSYLFLDFDPVKFEKPTCGNTDKFFFFNKCAGGNDCP